MNTSATRGAILVIAAVIVGAVVLGKGFEDDDSFGAVSVEAGAQPAEEPAEEPATTTDGAVIESIDTDGDGEPDTDAIDTDGDGVADTEAVDTDGDGVVDTPADNTPLTPVAHPPAEVRVLVANGAQRNGAAQLATDKLIARNYATLTPTNAEPQEATVIYYEDDYEADARLVAETLSALPDQLQPMPGTNPAGVDRREANILVVLGADQVAEAPEAAPEG